jgi:hypothetical protein
MKFFSAIFLWLLLSMNASLLQASPAFGPYGLLETRNLLLQAKPGNSTTSYFGSHRYGTYLLNSSNGCDLENRVYELDEWQEQWFPIGYLGCGQSTIELFLKEGGVYKIVSKVVRHVSDNLDYQIEVGLQVYSKHRYYAEDIESCHHFPQRFGWNFTCDANQCNKTNQNWAVNNDQAYWCKL